MIIIYDLIHCVNTNWNCEFWLHMPSVNEIKLQLVFKNLKSQKTNLFPCKKTHKQQFSKGKRKKEVLYYAPGYYCPGGGEVLPFITYTGMCRPTGSWFWSFWFRTGYPFQRRFLERGIIFRTHESSSLVSSHLKLFKDRLLLKIGFNTLTTGAG